MPAIKKPLQIGTVFDAVCEDVKQQFKDRLPPEWKDVVWAAVYPQLLTATDCLFQMRRDSDGGVELLENPGFTNFRKCFSDEPDLAGEIWSYARKCYAEKLPHNCRDTQAALVRAVLLMNWHATAVKEKTNGKYRTPTRDEWKQIHSAALQGKRPPLKLVELCQLTDGEGCDWIEHEYRLKITKGSFKTARQSLSKSRK